VRALFPGMADAVPGYPPGMGKHTKQPVEEQRAVELAGVPEEEGLAETEKPDPVHAEPEEHLNRPEQPDFDPAEREQYQQPTDEDEDG
jgi:hypothetical protein